MIATIHIYLLHAYIHRHAYIDIDIDIDIDKAERGLKTEEDGDGT